MIRTQVETALDAGQLWATMRNGRYWKLRRNGRTQTWKTRPMDFRIPVKAGLRSYASVTEGDSIVHIENPTWREANFVIAEVDPNTIHTGPYF